MNKIRLLQVCSVVLLFVVSGSCCREEFNDHYDAKGNTTISKNIIEVLREREDFSLFIQMVDRAGLAKTLGESGIYTCLAPKNEDVEAYLSESGNSIESIPLNNLKMWINYHFINGMVYLYDFEKKYEGVKETDNLVYASNVVYTTRDNNNTGSKFIRVFTPSYFNEKAADYVALRGVEKSGFVVENAAVSETERDIPASNGVIHVLEEPLKLAPRADEAIAADPELSIISNWLDRYVIYSMKGEDQFGKIDTTKTKHYSIGRLMESTGSSTDIADETKMFTMFVPTNAAIKKFFDPYIEKFGSYENMPKHTVDEILTSIMAYSSSPVCWGMSDVSRNKPYLIMESSAVLGYENDLQAMYEAPLLSSNANIYKVNELPLPPSLHSIEEGIFLNQNIYKEWNKLLVSGGPLYLTDYMTYQHPPRTLLIQPDEYWEKSVEDYDSKYLDTLVMQMATGVLNITVKNGEFEHRFYDGLFGSLKYEDGAFYDYKGNKARLVSTQSTWDGANGSIYNIDNFLEPLSVSDTTKNIYSFLIEKNPDFTAFADVCFKAEIIPDLKQTGYFSYTVFAPTNQAFNAAGINTATLTKAQAVRLVSNHIINNRKIFTDGMTTGNIGTLAGNMLTFSGAWDSFIVTDLVGKTARVVDKWANKQASNGVFHGISTVLMNE